MHPDVSLSRRPRMERNPEDVETPVVPADDVPADPEDDENDDE